jgi:uncharacterized protein YciI
MGKAKMIRPNIVTNEHLEFLDHLRESGDVNMCGAASNLRDEFGLDKTESREILNYWMMTFGDEER